MSAQLTRQQVNDFKIQLMSRFIEMQRDLAQENALLYNHGNSSVDSSVDPELEGCINLLFDLNYADIADTSEHSIKSERHF
jgi:hypothetical protein